MPVRLPSATDAEGLETGAQNETGGVRFAAKKNYFFPAPGDADVPAEVAGPDRTSVTGQNNHLCTLPEAQPL